MAPAAEMRGKPVSRLGYPGSEKLEIIGLVEQFHSAARTNLVTLAIQKMIRYPWYAPLQAGRDRRA